MKKILALLALLLPLAASAAPLNADWFRATTLATVATLGTPSPGTIKQCTDCRPGSNPCVVGGVTGALAYANSTGWVCGEPLATTSLPGNMSAADKLKLDGIATGATAYDNEQAQDAVGGILDSTLVYVDGTPVIKRAPLTGDISCLDGSNTCTLPNIASAGTGLKTTINAKGQATAVTTAACSDLSDDGTACTANTGTSGATVPFLNGTNTWANIQTFSSAPVMSGASITSNTIANASLANMAANTVKANITGGAAAPTDVTLASFKAWLAIVAADISDFAANVRSTVLTGLSTATNAIITASDTVLSALGKLQAQISAFLLTERYNAVRDFGMVGDHRGTYDGACSTGANTKITSATAAFVAGDFGKRITLAGAGTSAAMLVGTISNVDSATQVTISGATCAVTVTGKGLQLGTDNTTACNLMVSTINAQTYPAAKVTFPPSETNRYACPVALPFTVGVDLVGQASAVTQDAADYVKSGGTALAWWGTTNDGGTDFQGFIQWAAVTANNRPLSGAGLHDIWIDCRNFDQNPCAIAVRMVDVVGFDVDNLFVMDSLVGFSTTTADMGGITASTGRGLFSNIGARLLDNTNTPQGGALTAVNLTPTFVTAGSNGQVMTTAGSQSIAVNAANGFATPGYFWFTATNGSVYLAKCAGGGGTTTLTSCEVDVDAATENPTLSGTASAATASSIVQASPNNAACFLLEGTTSTNSNLFTMQQGRWSTGTNYGPACFEFHNSDSIEGYQQVVNGGNNTNDGAMNRIRRPGVRFGGSAVSAAQASRNNTFKGGDPGAGGVVNIALTNAGALLTAPTGPNLWLEYQLGNGAPIPVREAVTASATQAAVGANFRWTPNGGFYPGLQAVSTANQGPLTAGSVNVIAGGVVPVPPQGFQVGALIEWTFGLSKTAASTGNRIYGIRYTANGANSGGTLIASCVATGVTAAADIGVLKLKLLITALSPSPGSATATALADYSITKNGGNNVGLGVNAGSTNSTACTMTAFDSFLPASGPRFLHLEITPGTTTANEVLTVVPPVMANVLNPGNP